MKMILAMNEYINALASLAGISINMPHIEISTSASLAVIFGVLTISILLSLTLKKAETSDNKQTEDSLLK
jgi:tellurite resistance protein TerC